MTEVLGTAPAGRAMGLLRAMRPRQWVKNVLVFTAPVVSGRIAEPRVELAALVAFACFCLAASGVYLINDVLDAEEDRAHPQKRHRPIAAGVVPPPVALATAVVLFAAAIAAAVPVSDWLFVLVLVYVAVQLSYCVGLKHQPVIDLCIVGSGFLMRAMAGGLAASIALSQWFLLTAAFGSLFMVSGKRYAELQLAEQTGAKIRRSLAAYSSSYLRFVWTLSATALVTTYGLWAFELRATSASVWTVISMVPFVVAVLRYAVDVDNGDAGEPESIALSDRVLQVLALAWLATLAVSIYA